jgi:hypothetical protein
MQSSSKFHRSCRSTASSGLALALALSAATFPADAAQIAYVDAQGRSWRQVTETVGASWQSIAQRCPVDGTTPCAGVLGQQDLTGWVWATDAQVAELFEEFMPGISEAGSLSGSNCVLPGLWITGTFTPTWSSYTTFGASFYISGWTSTTVRGGGVVSAIAPEVSAGYQPNFGSFNLLAAVAATSASQYRGAWLFLPPACPGDLDRSGDVGAGDLASLLGAWGTSASAADLDGDGIVGAGDVSILLGSWGNCGG